MMVRTQVQLTKEQVQTLRKLAAERGISVAELVRQAVDMLVQADATAPFEERRRRALEAAGRFASGHRDVSAKHDEHLEQA